MGINGGKVSVQSRHVSKNPTNCIETKRNDGIIKGIGHPSHIYNVGNILHNLITIMT